jgi:hypothetical protein
LRLAARAHVASRYETLRASPGRGGRLLRLWRRWRSDQKPEGFDVADAGDA